MKKNGTFSIIIPVLHEEKGINALLDTLYQQFSGESFDIIVADGDPEGSTIRTICFPEVRASSSTPGRGTQMNAGAQLAQGDYLIFLHADTMLPAEAFQHIRNVLADGRYVAGAFKLGLDSEKWIYRLIARAASWRYRLSRLPYGDQAFFMHKRYFFDIGGFQDIPVMEDIEFMRRIKQRKEHIHITMKYQVTTSVRRWEKEGPVYSVLRGWVLSSLFCIGMSPQKLWDYYRAHHESRRGNYGG